MSEEILKTESRENKMGTMPMNKLLISMAVPMMLSMLVQALYNIVDSIFVARLSEDALTAVSLAFPVQNLMIALGSGTGVGINALLSKSLGAKDQEKADRTAGNGVLLMMGVNYLICFCVGAFLIRPFFESQTDSTVIINYGVEYLSIIMMCSIGLFGQMVWERLLQSTGRTLLSMYTQMIGAFTNIILDPIFIFGMFGMPALGMKGAAVATITGQLLATTIGIILNIKKNPDLHLKAEYFKPRMEIIGKIYSVGVPSIIMGSIGSVMTYGMNRILMGFSSTATAVFGVYFKLQSFFFMPVFGLNNGLVPIVAFNYGAKNKKRMMEAYKRGIMYAVCIMLVGTAIFEIFPKYLFKLFDASENMLSMGIPAVRIIAIHFVVAAFCIITGTMFQALGNGVFSMIVSIARQLVVLLPAAYLLSLTGYVNNVWWAFPIAEIASALISAFLFKVLYNRQIKNL